MKKLTTSLIASGLLVSTLFANEAEALKANITAVKVNADLSALSYDSKIWANATFSDVVLYPQTTIKFNDKQANDLNADNKAKKAKVAAVYNNQRIAFLIKWTDGTVNVQQGYKTNVFADGFAVQFAKEFKDVNKLPYIGMGSEGREVVIHLQKAVRNISEPNGNGNVFYQQNPNQTNLYGHDLENFNNKTMEHTSNDYERSFVAAGFRSMSEIKDASSLSNARLGYKDGSWNGTLSRPMADSYTNLKDSGVLPVAFAVWDGAKMGRDGLKNLSQWLSVKLEGSEGGDDLIAALDASSTEGDAEKGKLTVAEQGCVGCHQVEKSDVANLMGPALFNVGGYSTSGYLRESLTEPSAVVVPGYNRNAHSNYMWYMVEEDGKRTSTMTPFTHLSAEELNNVVAYLKTLKVEVE